VERKQSKGKRLINLFGGKFKGYGTLKLRVNLCRGGRKGDAGENLRVLL
jgi:hypothetical protein